MMRKPSGSRITVSFNTLPVGVHNWDLCPTERLEYDDCDPNSALAIHCDNSWNEEDIQVGYIYIFRFSIVPQPCSLYEITTEQSICE